jgi:uncharacterized membrane protein
MKTADFFKGKWLGHPLHPALVHVPAGLWPAALVFDFLSQTGLGNVAVQLSFFCIAFGLLAALAAVPAGIFDWSEIKKEKPAWKIGVWHMSLNLLAAALFAANLGLRFGTFRTATTVPLPGLALSAIGVFLVMVSGYLGGQMVYSHGIGVARMSKKKWRMVAEKGGSNVPPEREQKS